MAQNQKPRVRFVFQRSSLLTKTVVLATLVVTTVVLLALTLAIRSAQKAEAASRAQALALEQQIAELNEDIQQAGSVENHKELAEKELGLVDPDTVIFTPEN